MCKDPDDTSVGVFVFVGQPLALPVDKKALAMDIIKTPWYIEVEVRQPNKIYQGGPSHEREGHK